jgi:hypothetical protein
MSNRNQCEACLFWQCIKDDPFEITGLCRRHAPQTVKDDPELVFRRWPATFSDDWCGEFVDSGRQLHDELPHILPRKRGRKLAE